MMHLRILIAALVVGVTVSAYGQARRDYAKELLPSSRPPAAIVAAGGWGGGSCDSGSCGTGGSGYGGFSGYGGYGGGYGGYGGMSGGYEDAGGSEGCQYPGNCAIHGCGSGGFGTQNRGGVVTSPVPPATQTRPGPAPSLTSPPPPPAVQPAQPAQPPAGQPATSPGPVQPPPTTTGGPVDQRGFPILVPPANSGSNLQKLIDDLRQQNEELKALLTQQGKPGQDTGVPQKFAEQLDKLSSKQDATHQAVVQLGEQVKQNRNLTLTVQAAANLPPSYIDVSTIWAVQRRTKYSHMVLVVDSRSADWESVKGAYLSAQSKFPVIQMLDVATDNLTVKPTPQLVAYYTDGRKPEVTSGKSAVLDTLRGVTDN